MSSGWEYSEYALLPSAPGHSSPITAVAISPKGTLIAVATSGGDVNIWELAGQKIIYAFHGGVTILSLKWDPSEKDQLICGMDDGYLASLSFLDNKIHVSGFVGHSSPVNCIDINDLQVASGAANEVRVWQWYTYDPWKLLVELPYPPRTGQRLDDNQRVVTVTSLQWLSSGKQLLVAYLYHGICIYETKGWSSIRNIVVDGRAARVDVAEDARRMAVSNLLTGFDLYSTSSGKLVRALGHDVGAKRATPVRFIESGSALVGGTTMGELMIWDTTTGRKLQTLIYHDHRIVLALDAQYDHQHGRHLIAAGSFDGVNDSVCVWAKRILNDRHHSRAMAGIPSNIFDKLNQGWRAIAIPVIIAVITSALFYIAH